MPGHAAAHAHSHAHLDHAQMVSKTASHIEKIEHSQGQSGHASEAISKELNQLRQYDISQGGKTNGGKQFQADLAQINDQIHQQGFPNVKIVDQHKSDSLGMELFTILDLTPLDMRSLQSIVPPAPPPSDSSSSGGGGSSSGGGYSGGGGYDSGGGYSGGGGYDSGGGYSGGGGYDSGGGYSGGGGYDSGGGYSGGGGDSSSGSGASDVQGGSIDAGSSSGLPDLSSPNLSQYYEYPITGSAVQNPERVDQGVDFGGSGQYHAIGDSVVDAILPNWYQGQPLVELTLTDGPLKGHQYYVAEGIQPLVKVGQTVNKGDVIANITGGPTGIETGWGAGQGKTLAQATSGYTEGQATPAGQSFSQFLQKLGGPGGR